MRMLYLLRSGELMPIQISLPPTSLTPYKNFYNMVFALRSRPIYSSIVSIGLKRASNSSYDYSVATFRKVRDLTGEELANVQAYATTFREQLKASLSEQAVSLEMDTGSVEVGSSGTISPSAPVLLTASVSSSRRKPACPVQMWPSPSNGRGQPAFPQALDEEQRQFAAKHHRLIYSYLWIKKLKIDDYYDIAVFGYLRAVRQYLAEPSPHKKKFSTLAWSAMRQSIASFHRAEKRREETEQKYLKMLLDRQSNPFEELEARLLLHDLAAVSGHEQVCSGGDAAAGLLHCGSGKGSGPK